MMVGTNLGNEQLQQIVDKTILYSDTDGDGKISFEEFCQARRRSRAAPWVAAAAALSGMASRSSAAATHTRR